MRYDLLTLVMKNRINNLTLNNKGKPNNGAHF